jgi:hypothetical protein
VVEHLPGMCEVLDPSTTKKKKKKKKYPQEDLPVTNWSALTFLINFNDLPGKFCLKYCYLNRTPRRTKR